MKILVTGGSGYLGTHVRRFFSADDLSRRAGRDILNTYDLEIVSDYDVVIHLAAHMDKSPTAAEECFRVNAEGTANVLRHMRHGAVFIYASTKDVYGAFADEYSEVPETCRTGYCGQSALEWSKLLGERYVDFYAAERDLRACIFRMSTVYARASEGNEPNFVTHYVESVKRGWPIRFPAQGEPVRDILHVDDFARACKLFIDSSLARGLYNIGGGRENAVSLREIVERVGRMIELVPNIDEAAQLPVPVPFSYVTDISRIDTELRWRPEITVEEGLKSLL